MEQNTSGQQEVNQSDENNQAVAGSEGVHVVANHDPKVDAKETKFNFRSVKDETTGQVTKRETVTLNLPVPSIEGIVAILEAGGKGLELLLEATANVVIERARELVSDDLEASQDNFQFGKLSWEEIANQPKAERRGHGIPKETWEDFIADYIAIMPTATGRTAQQVGNAAKLLANRLSSCKTDKKVLNFLKDQISVYIVQSPSAESFTDVIEFLQTKIKTFLEQDESNLLANL